MLTKFITSLPFIVVTCDLYFGDQLLSSRKSHSHRNNSTDLMNDIIDFGIPLCNIPHQSRICINIYCLSRRREEMNKWVLVGWCNFLLFDHRNLLKRGKQTINMWLHSDPGIYFNYFYFYFISIFF